jgi:hypothetical protein
MWQSSRRLATLTAIAAGGASFVAGCGGSSSASSSTTPATQAAGALNTKRVAVAIEQSIVSKRRLHATVVCPPKIPQRRGLTFTCVATTHDHKRSVRTLFSVFQKDNAGNVYYQSPR